MVVEVLSCSGWFLTCMGAHFPAVELDNANWLSILSRMSGFLWHSSKWDCRFGRFLQYTSGLKVFACSPDIDVNYAPTALFPEPLNKVVSTFGVEMRQLLGVFSKIDTQSRQYFLLNSRPSARFPTESINSLDEIPKIPS